MPNKGLATSGTRWGLSCTVADEASMGVILGYMKLFGADEIGFAPLGPVAKRRASKNPERVAAGRKGGLARQARRRRGTAERKPLLVAAEEALSGMGAQFTTAEFNSALKKLGWKGSAQQHRVIDHLIKTKHMRRKERGTYIKLPALVKATG